MIRMKLLYIAALIGLAIFVILFEDTFALVVFLTALILPIFFLLYTFYLSLRVSVSLTSEVPICTYGDTVNYQIHLKNSSFLPAVFCEFQIVQMNAFAGTKSIQKKSVYLAGRHSLHLNETVTPTCCGNIRITAGRIVLYDFIRLFHWKRKQNISEMITCLPDSEPASINKPYVEDTTGESNIFSKIKSGDDPSEIYNLRDFREGDSMRQIHWKLSFKQDSLMVRENSLPLAPKASIVFLLSLPKELKNRSVLIEKSMEALMSVSLSLLQNEITHELFWYQEKQQFFCHQEIAKTEDLYEAMGEIFDGTIPAVLPASMPSKINQAPRLIVTAGQEISFHWEDLHE